MQNIWNANGVTFFPNHNPSNITIPFNSSSPGQNGRHCGRWHFQMHFLYGNDKIPIQISLKLVPKCPSDNKPATSHYLNQWWPSSLMHICSTRGRWVNNLGIRFTKELHSSFEFNENNILMQFNFWPSDRYTILHMPQQPSSQGMCTSLQASHCYNLNNTKITFILIWKFCS